MLVAGLVAGVLGLVLLMAGLQACRLPGQGGGDQLAQVKARGYLRVGTLYTIKPFGYLDDTGRPVGFDIDLIKAISQRLLGQSSHIEFVETHVPNRVSALNSKQVDFILGVVVITPSRMARMEFTQAYHHAPLRLVVRKDSLYKTAADLTGKPVGFLLGGTSDTALHRHHPGYKLSGFKNVPTEYHALLDCRLQAFGVPEGVGYGLMARSCQIRLLPDAIEAQRYGVAFRKDPATDTLRQAVNTIIAELEADGTLKALREKWLQEPSPDRCTSS
ncbi:MAG: amino acid ABC transporter substrate-binding protein [Cyanobacteria bacterium HKST-UBA03]|nr:amino acid ABC transporter substrate-binding protein [Cyanobacteria bacterium HKST-UBA03]